MLFENIRADLARKRDLYHNYHGWVKRYVTNLIDLGAWAVLVYRYGRWVYEMRIPVIREMLMIPYLIAKVFVIVCGGIYIPVKARIGKGFVVHNFSGIFIAESTIGENCTVQQGVTLGGVRP